MEEDIRKMLIQDPSGTGIVLQKWERLGFLGGIENEELKERVSEALELCLANLLYSFKKYDIIQTAIFPVMVRIFRELNTSSYTYGEMYKMVPTIIEDFYKNYSESGVDSIHGSGELDIEAIFCKNYCDKYILKFQNKNNI